MWDSVDVWESAHVKKKITLPDETHYFETEALPKGEVGAEVPVLCAVRPDISARCAGKCLSRLPVPTKAKPEWMESALRISKVDPVGSRGFWMKSRRALETKTYRPSAVRRVWIPKPDGRQRPLGIPTIRDRVIQTALLLIIEPIFEADFMDCSYGFRPERSAHDALEGGVQAPQGGTAVCV